MQTHQNRQISDIDCQMQLLTTKTARGLLKDVQFPGDADPTYLIAVLGKQKRKDLLLLGNEDSRIAAAVEVQRVWRGYRTRCKLSIILDRNHGNAASTSPEKRYPWVMAQYKEYVRWCVEQGIESHSSTILSLEDYSARIIQSWWRRLAGQVQKVVQLKPRVLDEQTAAAVIQRAWRNFSDVKIYKFYRDLINFRGRGDPALLLRCINPAEAKLMDKATGAHVRFRLGGARFPPNVYYKVFTHRPVVDLCAYSPRDYTAMSHRSQLGRDIHNKDPRTIEDDRENWYRRWENNGWRLVSDRLFLGPLQDPITTDTASKKQEFHHSKVQRKEEVERRRKHRKIEWLKKMYHQGTLQARQDLGGTTTSAVNVAADQLVELTDTHGAGVVEEGDVDELLQWTNALNYEEYITDWYLSASSAFSDDTHQMLPSAEDPFEINVKPR